MPNILKKTYTAANNEPTYPAPIVALRSISAADIAIFRNAQRSKDKNGVWLEVRKKHGLR